MKLVDRYIFLELARIFLLGVGILMAILILEKIHFLSGLILQSAITARDFFLLFAYIGPSFLTVSIPLAVLLAGLVVFTRMAGDNELTALRSSGMGTARMMAPMFLFSILAWLATSYLAVDLEYRGNYEFKKLIYNIVTKAGLGSFKERVFIDRFRKIVIYMDEAPPGSQMVNGVFLSDSRDELEKKIITARHAFIEPDYQTGKVSLKLMDGTIHRLGPEEGKYRLIKFELHSLMLEPEMLMKVDTVKVPREMSAEELQGLIAAKQETGGDALPERVNLERRYAIPFGCITLGLFGAPLGMRLSRSGSRGSRGGSAGFGVGALVIVANYILLLIGQSLGATGALPVRVAVWGPNVIMLAMGLWLIRKNSMESMPMGITLALRDAWEYIRMIPGGRGKKGE